MEQNGTERERTIDIVVVYFPDGSSEEIRAPRGLLDAAVAMVVKEHGELPTGFEFPKQSPPTPES